MNKRNKWVTAARVHLVVWGILLVNSAIDLLAVVCFPPTYIEALGYFLEKGIGVLAVVMATVGVITGVLLFFSARGQSRLRIRHE